MSCVWKDGRGRWARGADPPMMRCSAGVNRLLLIIQPGVKVMNVLSILRTRKQVANIPTFGFAHYGILQCSSNPKSWRGQPGSAPGHTHPGHFFFLPCCLLLLFFSFSRSFTLLAFSSSSHSSSMGFYTTLSHVHCVLTSPWSWGLGPEQHQPEHAGWAGLSF